MNHITKEKYEKILKAAAAVADLENGNRQQTKEREKLKISYLQYYGNEVKKLPKEFIIVYTESDNLGTSRYADYYKRVAEYSIKNNGNCKWKETEKSIVVELYGGYKKVISKERILAYVY